MTINTLLVIKIGGGAGLNMRLCAADIANIAKTRPVVVVHGVSDMMNRLCEERGIPVKMLTSPNGHISRYTDAVTRDVFVEAAGRVNAQLVALLAEQGVKAAGFVRPPNSSQSILTPKSPLHFAAMGFEDTAALTPPLHDMERGQGGEVILQAERKAAIRAVVDGRVRMIRDDYSGTIIGVNVDVLLNQLQAGMLPVLPPLANSPDGLLNVDGDRAAAAAAGALGASDFIILSNVRGLYQHFPDENSFVSQVNRMQLDEAQTWAEGRMKRKVLGAAEALNQGVQRVIIADGRVENPVSAALNGAGTHFT